MRHELFLPQLSGRTASYFCRGRQLLGAGRIDINGRALTKSPLLHRSSRPLAADAAQPLLSGEPAAAVQTAAAAAT